jgi:thiamine biosynthesis lipoprotein
MGKFSAMPSGWSASGADPLVRGRRPRRPLWTGAGILLLASVALLHAADLRSFEGVEPHMGTLFRIKLYAADEQQAKSAFRAAFDRVRDLDAILSDYKPDSELNRISRNPQRISEDLFRVLATSQKLAEETGGAFDVTLGPVIRLWREARKNGKLPDSESLREAGNRCGYRKLHLDAANRTAMLDQPGMQLDVGGIAKGYAADEALAVLNQLGIRNALVAASGDLAFSDPPPGQKGWKIGVGALDRALELRNAAVSTSGDAEQHLDTHGKRYSHIIDPETRMGLTSGITVTIIAPRGIDADGMSTAVSVLGVERGVAFVEKHAGAAAVIVTREGDVVESSRFQRPGEEAQFKSQKSKGKSQKHFGPEL